MMLTTLCGTACAEHSVVEENGFRVEMKTDKDSYAAEEAISVTLSVRNMNDAAVNNVVLENFAPAGFAGTNTYQEVPTLAPGASGTVTSRYVPFNIPNTGDETPLLLLMALLLGSGAGLAFLAGKKNSRIARRVFALLLSVAMTGSCFSGQIAFAAEDDGDTVQRMIDVSCTVMIDGAPVVLQSSVRFSSEGVTREEWIAALVGVMGYDIVDDGRYTFDDWYLASDPAVIETAIRCGLLKLEPDGDNIVRVYPQASATRDFLASTANNGLMFTNIGSEVPAWDDYARVPHKEAARMAVDFGLLNLVENAFCATRVVSEQEKNQAVRAIRKIQGGPDIPETPISNVKFAENVIETTLWFTVNEEAKIVTVFEPEKARGWRVGEVHVLHSTNPAEEDIAIKITSIRENGSVLLVHYEHPEMHEAIESLELAGSYDGLMYLTPAEGVTISPYPGTMVSQSRESVSDTVAINQGFSFSIDLGDDSEVGGSISIKNVEYRFSASPYWRFPFVTLDEVYVALNSELELNGSITLLDAPSFSGDSDDMLEWSKSLGDIKIPVGGGFNLSAELDFVVESDGIQIVFEWTCDVKNGVQYTSGDWIKPVFDANPSEITPKLSGSVEPKVEFELEGEFLRTIRLLEVGLEVGVNIGGELKTYSDPTIFCVDGLIYLFVKLFAEFGPEVLGLRLECEVINEDNVWDSLKVEGHWEETGKVEECTRGSGKYAGTVKDVGNGNAIYRAKVEVYKNGRSKDLTYTDSDGKFVGIELPSGKYTLRVSAAGYVPYETTISIVGGQTTQVPVQLMLGREDEAQSGSRVYTISGRVTDASTGYGLGGVRVTFHDASLFGVGAAATTVATDSNGYYSASVKAGIYEVAATKPEYVPSGRTLTVLGGQSNINFSLSPENQSAEGNSLRAVLQWGAEPSDLDSHLSGPTGHVYYYNMSVSNASLDVDDVTSYGPETIVLQDTESGIYRYYVHDYSNRDSRYSTAISDSGANVALYNGSTHLYTIHVPEGEDGTLWHVFNFDPQTMEIELINSFSYQSEPEYVGGYYYRSNDPVDNEKTYTEDKHR